MNTKSIYTVGKCLLLLLLIFTGYACEDNDEGKENTSAPVLISCNINGTEVDLANIDSETENNLTAGTDGYVEFVFSKAMRQTPPTKDEETGEVLIENSTFYNTGNGSFITASRSNETDAYGYVMKDCTIDGEAGITAFSFGRQQSTSAKAVFINTALKMDIIDGHWTAGSAAPALFGEYNTVDKNNQVISTGDMTVGSGSSQFTAKVLSADEAAGYTYENIIAREGWNPKQYMQTPGTTMATLDGTTLSWNAIDGAAGYLIFVNGVYLAQTTETSVSVTTAADGVYTVRGVGHYGSISAE